ncbi:MAG: hypothetical protein ACE5IT_01440, partial [bacterium]
MFGGHLVNARGVKSPLEVSSKGILVFDHRLSLRATERGVAITTIKWDSFPFVSLRVGMTLRVRLLH